MTKNGRDGNFDRADIRARAAQRGSIRQFARSLRAEHLRRKDRADGTRDERTIREAADIFINGTNIRARAATNTFEHVASHRVFENFRSAIIEQHKMKFFRTKLTFSAAWTRDELGIRGKFLSCGRARQ